VSGIAPLAVWDANARGYADIHVLVMEFLISQGIPVSDTYRVEVYLFDAPFARVFTYAGDERGYRYFDPGTEGAAVNDPYDVPLTALPPDSLRVLMPA
jgi:hypothetical protein